MSPDAPLERAEPIGAAWDAPLDEAPLVFLDLEMTGTDPASARVCEVAALRWRAGTPEAELVSLVNPETPVGDSQRIHGISDASLAGAPLLASLREPLQALLDGAVLVGHSIAFDQAFLAAAHARGELDAPPAHALDTRLLAKRAWHHAGYGLATLCAARSLAAPAHRAAADANACAALFDVLRKELRARTARQLFQTQSRDGARFREDVEDVLRQASHSGRPVRFAYRVPGRDAFEDVLEVSALTPPRVVGRLRGSGLVKTLRGDRLLWASLCEAEPELDA